MGMFIKDILQMMYLTAVGNSERKMELLLLEYLGMGSWKGKGSWFNMRTEGRNLFIRDHLGKDYLMGMEI